jgi:hypothetical protein
MTNTPSPIHAATNRRQFLAQAGGGLGMIALASLLDGDVSRASAATGGASKAYPLAPQKPHFAARAKRVIWLFMHGGPSHVDLFDPKPDLVKYSGQPLPDSFGMVMTRRDVASNPLLAPIKPFRPRGKSGIEISDFLPHVAECADELCVIRSLHGDSVNHPQSVYQMNTGSILMGKPSVGAWVTYGLGTENNDLPAFVVMLDSGPGIKGGPPAWGSGFLPAVFQGTPMRASGSPILHLAPQAEIGAAQQRRALDLLGRMNRQHLADRPGDDELSARIESYELAYRMQTAAPDLVDIRDETAETLALYGVDEKETRDFGTRCLLARRMVERGVRFVQLYSGDTNGWDAHNDVAQNHGQYCRQTDKPVAGLLKDLRRRGLLDETLVIWAGEFGRMPMSEQGKGRDHNPWGYTAWLAGGGTKPGFTYGATDPIGLRAAENKVHIRDFHATLLHLLGIDHTRLSVLRHGLEEKLTTAEEAHVVKDVLA